MGRTAPKRQLTDAGNLRTLASMPTYNEDDPEKRVHVLRRKTNTQIEAAEKARQERIAFNTGTLSDWEIEAATATTQQARSHAQSMVEYIRTKQQRETLEKALARASAWKGIAITLAVMLAALAWMSHQPAGRPMGPDKNEMHER